MNAQHIKFLDLLDGKVHYVVPRWQRGYCWGREDIERLVEDLLTIAAAGSDAAHYGGTLLTFPEPDKGPSVVKTYRVVDGQQRLTTVSILLACIADELGSESACGDWTGHDVRDRLINARRSPPEYWKLRLQDADDEEYRQGFQGGAVQGSGAVAQAWKIARRLVNDADKALLLKGLERFRVVSIGLADRDDPQQIFESLNATGRPLTESEKVKNWLLIGLPDQEQQELHDRYWRAIEQSLGATVTTEPVDTFLRDLLRWRTGKALGARRVYEELRRWALKHGRDGDRPALCRDLARLAKLYGILTGAAGKHPDAAVERELRHLRAMGIDIHRPLTLRLLHDATAPGAAESPSGDATRSAGTDDGGAVRLREPLATVLQAIGAWLTRQWLADRPTAGTNTAAAELAHREGPKAGEDFAKYWIDRIRKLRHTRAGVPGDEDVREGIRTRKAYGGSATRTTKAILCELMEHEQGKNAPDRRNPLLTVEHIMPQKLTDPWRRDLGDAAEEIHGRWLHRLANLTLTPMNPELKAHPFNEKQKIYQDSTVRMTQRLADERAWDEDALDRRAEELADRVLKRWPWSDPGAPAARLDRAATLRWRIDGGPWQIERSGSRMLLKVAGALLDRDPANAEKLSGDTMLTNVHPVGRYPADHRRLRPIPGHAGYVLNPDWPRREAAELCRTFGDRCGVKVDVELPEDSVSAFWKDLKKHTGGLPGQTDDWRGPHQITDPERSFGYRIKIILSAAALRMYILKPKDGEGDAVRLQHYSQRIDEQMSDQQRSGDPQQEADQGKSISVVRAWTQDDEAQWPEAAQWIKDEHDRLCTILAEPVPAGDDAK